MKTKKNNIAYQNKDIASKVVGEALEEELGTVEEICQAAVPFAPEYDEEKVYQAWRGTAEQAAGCGDSHIRRD